MDRAVQGVSTFALLSPGSLLKKIPIAEIQALLVLGRGLGTQLGFKFPGDSALQSRAL